MFRVRCIVGPHGRFETHSLCKIVSFVLRTRLNLDSFVVLSRLGSFAGKWPFTTEAGVATTTMVPAAASPSWATLLLRSRTTSAEEEKHSLEGVVTFEEDNSHHGEKRPSTKE